MGRRVERTRGAGTYTESAFWGMIRSALRQKSRWWKPITICKNNARRKYQGSKKRQKWEYQCAYCKGWFTSKEVAVDHIKPVGTLKCADDLPAFVENLFCEVDNLQVLCKKHHDEKTKKERQ